EGGRGKGGALWWNMRLRQRVWSARITRSPVRVRSVCGVRRSLSIQETIATRITCLTVHDSAIGDEGHCQNRREQYVLHHSSSLFPLPTQRRIQGNLE